MYTRDIKFTVDVGAGPFKIKIEKNGATGPDYLFNSTANLLEYSSSDPLETVKLEVDLSAVVSTDTLPSIIATITDPNGNVITETFTINNPCGVLITGVAFGDVYLETEVRQRITFTGSVASLVAIDPNVIEVGADYLIVNKNNAPYSISVIATSALGCTETKSINVDRPTSSVNYASSLSCSKIGASVLLDPAVIFGTAVLPATIVETTASSNLSFALETNQVKLTSTVNTFPTSLLSLSAWAVNGTYITANLVIEQYGIKIQSLTVVNPLDQVHDLDVDIEYRVISETATVAVNATVQSLAIAGSGTHTFTFFGLANTGNPETVTLSPCDNAGTYNSPVYTPPVDPCMLTITSITQTPCDPLAQTVTINFDYENINEDIVVNLEGTIMNYTPPTPTGSGSVTFTSQSCSNSTRSVTITAEDCSDTDTFVSPAPTTTDFICFDYGFTNATAGQVMSVTISANGGTPSVLITTVPLIVTDLGSVNVDISGDVRNVDVIGQYDSSGGFVLFLVISGAPIVANWDSMITIGSNNYNGRRGSCLI